VGATGGTGNPGTGGDGNGNTGNGGEDQLPDFGELPNGGNSPVDVDAEMFGDAGPACGDGIVQDGEVCDDGNGFPGDGCNGACELEPNFSCPVAGQECVNTVVCGDGVLGGAEVCDDGNLVNGDGCASSCDAIEPFFACPTAGQDCLSLASCGDGRISTGEECDDTNFTDADGCDDVCQLETGYVCPVVGDLCTEDLYCGDGQVSGGEQCDDGLTVSGDGCTATCGQEPFYSCLNPGNPCNYIVECGDGLVQDQETCDDNNDDAGDGCDDSCVVEAGWACPIQGSRCVAAECGDGIIAGNEECEDGDATGGDGCDANCFREGPYACVTNLLNSPPSVCHQTTCNDGTKEGSEPCDDGNSIIGDGCNPYCEVEPSCPNAGGACTSVCGDGLLIPGDDEECDDGNTTDGDGCSHLCVEEEGYMCNVVVSELPATITIPFVFRDFMALPSASTTVTRHPDFQNGCLGTVLPNATDPDMVSLTLDADGKPTNSGSCALPAACVIDVDSVGNTGDNCMGRDDVNNLADDGCDNLTGCMRSTHPNHFLPNHASVDPFYYWYRDQADVNKTLIVPTTLNGNNGVYTYTPGNFFPMDDAGWVATGDELEWDTSGHNYGFTSEVRYWFTFTGGESLIFQGDDDLFVFVNGKLALSIGSKHNATTRTMVLSTANGGTATCAACPAAYQTRNLGITAGNVYEIAIFHAERQATASNFNLTLTGFVHAKSECESICGDDFVTKDEQCDEGNGVNADGYGTCQLDCTRGAYCGDNHVDVGFEECDNGVNLSQYGGCAPGCVDGPFCGDGVVQPVGLEQCDDGVNDGGYAQCGANCKLGPRCGDGVQQAGNGEQCDDGANNGGYGECAQGCLLGQRCGDGVVQANQGETCDDGVNDGGYGGCTAGCQLGPRCGDSIKQGGAGEECDDGANDGGYGQCAPGCKLGARCGDGARQMPDEQCDDGVNNGGYGECAAGCHLGPRCGDDDVQEPQEECDDGNLMSRDGCSNTCQDEGILQ
ncbi:MAG TPA: DUF4215 domain-containing protein, partial [Polyangiaceae bacterium]|nr:DUF4215 domain-containing protein [Polyangiaceae bacterium]